MVPWEMSERSGTCWVFDRTESSDKRLAPLRHDRASVRTAFFIPRGYRPAERGRGQNVSLVSCAVSLRCFGTPSGRSITARASSKLTARRGFVLAPCSRGAHPRSWTAARGSLPGRGGVCRRGGGGPARVK